MNENWWNVFHDGRITAVSGGIPGDLELTIECLYIREKIPDPGTAFKMHVAGCDKLTFMSFETNETKAGIEALVQLAISFDTGIHSRCPMIFAWNCESLPWNGMAFARCCGSSEAKQGFIDEPERFCWRPKASRSPRSPGPSVHAGLV